MANSNFVTVARKIYNPIGFKKGYNFVLWFIFGGAILGFSLARLQYLSIDGIFCNRNGGNGNSAFPGECYFYQGGHGRIGIILHLAGILPAGILVVLQFVPAIRYKFMIFHRVNGYAIIILSLLGNAGAAMIMRHAFGGTIGTQTVTGMMIIMTTLGMIMAYINIKRLQIDQHRAWMLRTWFYFASIITERFILLAMGSIVSLYKNYYFAVPCYKIDYVVDGARTVVERWYPGCEAFYSGENPDQYVIANARFGDARDPGQVIAAFNMSFGASLWVALTLHAIGVEIYLHLTPREAHRLRQVSYERQLAAGMKRPGNAGLTSERLGDADPFVPKVKDEEKLEEGKKQHSVSGDTLNGIK